MKTRKAGLAVAPIALLARLPVEVIHYGLHSN
jgi:hypothetical protein